MRRRLPGLLALVLVLAGCGDPDTEYGEELAEGRGKARVIELSGGLRLALTRPDEHTLVAQWGDGDSWTAGERVHSDGELTVGDLKVETGGRTAAIGIDLVDPRVRARDPEIGPSLTALVVCHELSCETSRKARQLSSPQVDSEGTTVMFPLDRTEMLLWREDEGFRTAPVDGIPPDSKVIVLADGAIVAGAARAVADGCRYELHTADASLTFSRAAATATLPGLCGVAAVESEGPDRVELYSEGLEEGAVVFVRDGDSWTAEVEEPAGTTVEQPLVVREDGVLVLEGEELALRIDAPRESVVLTPAGTVVRVSCQQDGDQWRPTYAVASADADSWPEARPLPGVPEDLAARTDEGCTSLVDRDEDVYFVEVGAMASSWSGEYRLEDGALRWLDPATG